MSSKTLSDIALENLEAAKQSLRNAEHNLEAAKLLYSLITKDESETNYTHNLNELQKIITRGRMVQGVITQSAAIGTFSRHWRKLLNDLRLPADTIPHQRANAALEALHIIWRDGDHNNKREFIFEGY